MSAILQFRELSTLREDVPLKENLNELKRQGAYPRLKKLCQDLRVKLAQPMTIEQQIESKNAAEFQTQHDDVFGRIADRYDLLCDLFSFGIHRLWKLEAKSRQNNSQRTMGANA